MAQKLKSKGSEHMQKITEQYNKYSAAVRVTLTYKDRLNKLINTFPKKERLLHQEKLELYIKRINGKEY